MNTRQARKARLKARIIVRYRRFTRRLVLHDTPDALSSFDASNLIKTSGLTQDEFSKHVLPQVWRSLNR